MGAAPDICTEPAVDRRLAEALDRSDDWSTVSDPVARRKLQNKLNQRARRRRQDPNKSTPLRSRLDDVRNGHQVSDVLRWTWEMPETSTFTAVVSTKSRPVRSNVSPAPMHITVHRRQLPDLYFPLSPDHLIHLVQLNVYRAFLTNMQSLGHSTLVACATDLDDGDTRNMALVSRPKAIPPTLEPTQLQMTTSHPPWVDVFPHAAFRDALILKHGLFDECSLYVDILGSIGNKSARADGTEFTTSIPQPSSPRSGMVVWGDPWRVDSWELEEGFVHHWGWLLKVAVANGNCDALFRATDKWRQLRGDDPMDWSGIKPFV